MRPSASRSARRKPPLRMQTRTRPSSTPCWLAPAGRIDLRRHGHRVGGVHGPVACRRRHPQPGQSAIRLRRGSPGGCHRRRRSRCRCQPIVPVTPTTWVAPWMAGLLPDNDRVLSRVARTFQVANSPFALLGPRSVRLYRAAAPCRQGSLRGSARSAGARRVAGRVLCFDPSPRPLARQDHVARCGIHRPVQLGRRSGQDSVVACGGRWGVPSGAAATSHILKPAISGFDHHDLNENLCLRAAQNVGLLAANSTIERFGDQSVVVSERYDRVRSRMTGCVGLTRRICARRPIGGLRSSRGSGWLCTSA